MLDKIAGGFKSFWTLRNLGGLLALATLAFLIAWLGWTPERVASMVPSPRELWTSVSGGQTATG